MKIKTSDLTDLALDWAACEAAGLFAAYPEAKKNFMKMWQGTSSYYLHPSTNWAQGGPIIERERITVGRQVHRTEWSAEAFDGSGMDVTHLRFGPTPLIAAMRCYVASKLGDTVEIPEELT